MPGRYSRNDAILAKIETTYGTDSVPTGLANAILLRGQPRPTPLNAQNVDRDLVRPYFGASEQLVGVANVQVEFDVEIAGSGTAGTAPALGVLLRMCGMAEAITAGNRVEYMPVSTAFEAGTIYYHDDGVLHKLLGARGTLKASLQLTEVPYFTFSMTGLDGGVVTAPLPSTTLTGWKTPLPVTDANTGDVTLGCTYATGSLSGGTSYPSRGIQLDLGHAVSHMPLLGGESVEIAGRQSTGSFIVDASAAQEVTLYGTVKANTVQSLGFQHGTAAGNIFVVHAPAAQLLNYSKQDYNGKRMQGFDARFVPSGGNDELRFCFK